MKIMGSSKPDITVTPGVGGSEDNSIVMYSLLYSNL